MNHSTTTPINKAPTRNYSTILNNEPGTLWPSSAANILMGKLTREPIEMICPNCDTNIITNTNQVRGQLTYLICVLCALGCWCGLLPLIIDDFKDIEHNCPKCKALIGRHILDINSLTR